ncbi:MAG: bifunctional 2-polyprenyl-6-hydroxyphenol methylase/3-demethylubiquinol 3-O-methyltransferase UbiG [Hyphomicrobiaceae bacterium]
MIERTTSEANSSIDQREVEQFARQAEQWWDPRGPFRPLHQIGPTRLQYIRETVVAHFDIVSPGLKPLDGLDCLDVGCGGGLVSEPLARLGGSVTAIDPAPENIAVAKRHAEACGLTIDYRATTAEDIAAAGATFDVIVCLEVIEHVQEPEQFVATLASMLRTGGLLVMSTINRTPKSYLLAIVGAEYVLRWLPVGTHQWDKFVRPSELKHHMAAAGIRQFACMGLVYNLLADKWSLSDDVDVNYMARAARPKAD